MNVSREIRILHIPCILLSLFEMFYFILSFLGFYGSEKYLYSVATIVIEMVRWL